MRPILALDQGTTSSRAIVYGEDGRPVASAQQEFEQHFPAPGLVEHDPGDLTTSQLDTARRAIAEAGLEPADLGAIGITNQRETTLLWDRRSGEPVHRAIVWQDRRTAATTDRLRAEGHAERVRSRTGLVLDPYFSATKIAWILDRDPDLRRRAEAGELAFGTVDTWLVWQLTGGERHITDATNASRTLLFDLHRQRWDDDLLELFGVPRAILPEVVSSAGELATATALGGEIPICGIAGDQHAALFGQACFEPGLAKITYGTGAFALFNTGREPAEAEGVLTTMAWRLGEEPPVFATEGAVFVAGAAVQWLRDRLGIIGSAPEIEDLARSVDDSGGVVFVPALTGLASPHWDPHARGTILGLTRGSGRGELARACLEAIAHSSADAIEAMTGDHTLSELRVDGGASANALLLQLQADYLGCRVRRPEDTETTALGAAWLAAVGSGACDQDELASRWRADHSVEPGIDEEERAARRGRWRRAVAVARSWPDDGQA